MTIKLGSMRFLAVGVLVYTGDQLVPFGDRMWAVPMGAFWAGP